MAKKTEKQRVRGRPFQPGQSGNPRGRPKGALGKRTILMRKLKASDPIDLLEAQDAVSEVLIRYYRSERKVFSLGDIQLGVRLVISISDQMSAIPGMVRLVQAGRVKRGTKPRS